MSITTMEGLQAVPENSQVDVDGNTWTRTALGLKRLDVDLPLRFFEGRLAEGTVVDAARRPPATGEWWAGNTRTYYLTQVTDTRVHYLSWRGPRLSNTAGSSILATWIDTRTMHRIEGPPEVIADQAPLVEALALAQNENRQYREQIVVHNQERQNLAQMRNDLRDARAYLDRLHSTMNPG